jgi:hypothetical protein
VITLLLKILIQTIEMTKFSKSTAALPPSVRENPHYFVSKMKKMDKVDGPDADKSE